MTRVIVQTQVTGSDKFLAWTHGIPRLVVKSATPARVLSACASGAVQTSVVYRPSVGPVLYQRLRRWHNTGPTMDSQPVSGFFYKVCNCQEFIAELSLPMVPVGPSAGLVSDNTGISPQDGPRSVQVEMGCQNARGRDENTWITGSSRWNPSRILFD